nr:ribonuclease H-like domain-containing protein [Tanacetum cinerariifolium]
MWLFKHKFHADGTLSHYKARLVANGSSQQLGVDFDETFSPVVKPATIRMVLSLVVSRKWPLHQLDVKNYFLNGGLSETVYMHQPPGYATRVGFYHSRCDSFLFIYRQESSVAYLLLYVDDIILTASSTTLQHLIDSLHRERKYALQLLERAHMVNCNPSRTPVDTKSKLVRTGFQFRILLCTKVVQADFNISRLHFGYTDAEWTGCPSTCRSTLDYYAFLETAWLRNLLRELHSSLSTTTLVYCDNYADIFTKGQPSALFEDFRSSLSVQPPSAATAGAY